MSGRPCPSTTCPLRWVGFSTHRSGRSTLARASRSVPDQKVFGILTMSPATRSAYAFILSLSQVKARSVRRSKAIRQLTFSLNSWRPESKEPMVVAGVPESSAPSKRHCSKSRVVSGADQTSRRNHWFILPDFNTEHCRDITGLPPLRRILMRLYGLEVSGHLLVLARVLAVLRGSSSAHSVRSPVLQSTLPRTSPDLLMNLLWINVPGVSSLTSPIVMMPTAVADQEGSSVTLFMGFLLLDSWDLRPFRS